LIARALRWPFGVLFFAAAFHFAAKKGSACGHRSTSSLRFARWWAARRASLVSVGKKAKRAPLFKLA
jgi:hypothetical protein